MRNHSDVKNLNKKTLYDGFFKMQKYCFQFRRYDGDWSDLIEREVFERGEGAAVLLYDPHMEKIVLIEQIRSGALNDKNTPWLIEVVAGIIEPGFSAEETVIKEAKEETGLTVEHYEKINKFYLSPGGSSEVVHLFCAKVSAKKAEKFCGLAVEDEDIRVLVISPQEAFDAVSAGKINNAITIIALQWLEINQKTLKNRWKS